METREAAISAIATVTSAIATRDKAAVAAAAAAALERVTGCARAVRTTISPGEIRATDARKRSRLMLGMRPAEEAAPAAYRTTDAAVRTKAATEVLITVRETTETATSRAASIEASVGVISAAAAAAETVTVRSAVQ